jgi:hypothetical protein
VRRRERRAEEHEGKGAQAIGRECEKVTAARGVNSFFKETKVLVRETLPRAPQSPQKISPNAHQGHPVYDIGARVHKSYRLCAGLQVRKERTAARAYSAPPWGRCRRQTQSMTRGPRSTSHTVCVPNFGCGKSEPSCAPVVRLLGAAAKDKR